MVAHKWFVNPVLAMRTVCSLLVLLCQTEMNSVQADLQYVNAVHFILVVLHVAYEVQFISFQFTSRSVQTVFSLASFRSVHFVCSVRALRM